MSDPTSTAGPGPDDRLTDDELLEAAAVAEGDPAADGELPPEESVYVEGAPSQAELAAERDEYRDALLRVKAEFDNFKKRTIKERSDTIERAGAGLALQLLPVLDACEAALSHGSADVEPIYKSLLDTLGKEGLERMAPEGEAFDPNLHEAVMHEEGDGGDAVVTDSLRTGYAWKGQVLRPAMVKVRG